MATPIANGCDALSVPSGAVVAATGNAQLTNSENWSSAYGNPVAGDMKFFMGYCQVMTQAQLTDMNNNGVSVCLFYENYNGAGTISPGPAGTNPGYLAYYTYAQGYYDAQSARSSGGNIVGGNWPSTRPIYYTVDALGPEMSSGATSSNISNIRNYFDGIAAYEGNGALYVGVYTNPGAFGYLYADNSATWLWQDESLSQWNNGTLSANASGWQLFNGTGTGPAFYLSNGSSSIDGDFAYQATQQKTGDFGQFPAPSGGTNTATATTTSNYARSAVQSYLSTTNHDKVIFSKTINTSVSGTVGTYSNFYTLSTGINQTAYPVGIFSYDGGTTWNDFNFIFGNYGNEPAMAIQPTVDGSGNINLTAKITSTLGGGGSVSIIVKIALLATYSPGILLSANTTINQTLSYANVSALNKYGTYRRISADNHTGTGSGSISHGLGTVPNINFWAQVSGNTTLNPTGWGSTGPVGDLGFSMDSTYLYYNVGSGTYSDAYYRLYKDN